MNETMSLFLATAILAIGGLGLYMYKSTDGLDIVDYNEDNLFEDDINNDINDDFSSDDDDDDYSEDFNNYEPKVKSRGKTKRSKTSGGTKKKRY